MAKTFKNTKELEHFLIKQSRQALMKAQDEVHRIVKKWIGEFYKDYTPEFYERTAQLFGSLVQSRIVQEGKGYKAEVYFDLDKFQYSKFAWQDGNAPTGEEVFEAATQGLHGAIGDAGGGYQFRYVSGNTGVSIWNDPIRELDEKAIDILVDMLRAEGIPIKK